MSEITDQGLNGTVWPFSFTPGQIIGYRKDGRPIYPIAGGAEDVDGGGGNPAWNDFLQFVPEDKREEVTPLLQKWDKGAQDMVQKVHSEYEPWHKVTKSGFDPDFASTAIELATSLQTPAGQRQLAEALAEELGMSLADAKEAVKDAAEQGLNKEEGDKGPDLSKYDQYGQKIGAMEQILLAQHQEKLTQAEEAKFDADFKALKQEHPDAEEEQILLRMWSQDISMQEAYEQQIAYDDGVRTRRPTPPRIMGGGSGSLPSGGFDPKKASDKDVRNLVAQSLIQAREAAN